MNRRKTILAVVVLAVLAGVVVHASREYRFDLQYVALSGELSQPQRDEILGTLAERRRDIEDIDDVKVHLDAIDWIHHVEVARQWPDRIVVEVLEEEPIAYWNDDAYINDEGDVFVSRYAQGGDLAQLYGPAASEHEVMAQYQQLNRALARAGQAIDTLSLDERGSWEFTTTRGIRVVLGKDDIMERIQRFLRVVEHVRRDPNMPRIGRIDTRYSNGLAVSWIDSPGSSRLAGTDNSKREPRL